MTGQDLKNSILQLAIQGKLVPQCADDEPASLLLERIRKEKERLIKEKKIKKEKPLAPITEDEKPFKIPESWEWCRLGEICSHVVDCPHSTPIKSSITTNHPCIRTSEIKGGEIVWDSMQYLDDANYLIRINRLKPEPGDIVYAREGVYGDAVILPSGYEFCLGQRTMMMRLVLPEIISFIHKAIISPFVYGQAAKLNRESTTNVPHVNMADIVTFVLPLPPLAEQRRIVAKIEELMPLVEDYGKAQSELDALNKSLPEQLKQSILQEAIMGKLGTNNHDDEPASELLARIRKEKAQLIKEKKIKKEKTLPEITDEEKPFDIPKNWEWCYIGDIFAHNNGKQLNKGNAHGKLMDYITTSNLYWDYFVLDTLKQMPFEENEIERCQALPGDLLVCEGGDVGRACIWNYDYPIMLQNHLHKLRAYLPVETRYFYYIFYLYNKQGLIGGKGIGIQGFSSNALHNTLIPLPPLAEQHRIVEKLDALLPKISELNKQ